MNRVRTVTLLQRFAPSAVSAFSGMAEELLVDNASSSGTLRAHGWTQFVPWIKDDSATKSSRRAD